MMVLLALLLLLGLPQVNMDTERTGRQARLRCHVCEQENSFNCQGAVDCGASEKFCAVAAVPCTYALHSLKHKRSAPQPRDELDPLGGQFQVLVIGHEIFPRFYYVSKQCSQFCPLIERPPPEEKSFILLKPLPFLYVKCCESNLCNSEGLLVNETMFREHVGRASEQKHGSVKLAGLLLLVSALASLSLS